MESEGGERKGERGGERGEREREREEGRERGRERGGKRGGERGGERERERERGREGEREREKVYFYLPLFLGPYNLIMGELFSSSILPQLQDRGSSLFLIIYMKKLLSSDWLRQMQFSGNSV